MSKIASATIILMITTILSKILGFCREIVLASVYGASIYSDAYVTALNIPNVIFAMIGTSLITTLIPIYSKIKENNSNDEALKFLNNIINLVSIIAIFIMIIGIIFTEYIVKLFAVGFTGDILQITVDFTRILFVSILFISINNILKGFLQINNKFAVGGLVGIPYSMVIIIFIILSKYLNEYLLPIGTLIATITQSIFIIYNAHKSGYRYNLNINIKDENIQYMIKLIGPVVIGSGAIQINNIVDRNIASTLGIGVISSFNYANRLYGFVQSLFIACILTVMYTNISKIVARGNNKELKYYISKNINIIILLIIPISVGSIVLAEPIVNVIFKRGAFDNNAAILTANVLKIYMFGCIAYALRDLLSKVFYSLGNTNIPMKNGIKTIIINIILNLVLVKYIGYKGLALASCISAFIGTILLGKELNKRIGRFYTGNTLKKTIFASIIMGVIVKFIYNNLLKFCNNQIILLLISIISGVMIYSIVILVIKEEESKSMLDSIKNRINSKINNL